MPNDIGAAGYLGIAKEVTLGTWVTPAKYFPIRSESLHLVAEHKFIRSIRAIADQHQVKAGNYHVEGDIELDLTPAALAWLMQGMRGTVVKSGAGPYTYTLTPAHTGVLATGKSVSLSVFRPGVNDLFGYTGCCVGSLELSTDEGSLVGRASIVGLDEADQTPGAVTWSTTDLPFGPGEWDIEIPDASDVSDVNTFTATINDNAEAVHRLRATRAPRFIKFGERQVTLTMERDFETRTDYDAFKAATGQSAAIVATQGANDSIELILRNAIKESYEHPLSGQGDLVMASVNYQALYAAASSDVYSLIAKSNTENIT